MAKKNRLSIVFSPADEKKREYYRENRRAYYYDCLRIRDRLGAGIIPATLNAGQEALENLRDDIENFHKEVADYIKDQTGKPARQEPVRMLVLKARRVGFSTDIAMQMFHYCEHNSSKNGLVVAHLAPNAHNIAQISRRFSQQFPDEHESTKIPMNKEGEEIEWGNVGDKPWDSRIIIATAASKNFARSFEYNFVHLSECAHYTTPDSIAAAKDAAQYADYIYEESTANGLDPYFYRSWQSALTLSEVRIYWRKHRILPPGWNGKYRFFWAWWQDTSYSVPLTQEQADDVMSTLTEVEAEGLRKYGWEAEQIEWRRRKIAGDCSEQTQMDPESYFNQEYPSCPEEAFISSGSYVFPSIYLSKLELESRTRKPIKFGYIQGYSRGGAIIQRPKSGSHLSAPLVLWEEPLRGASYIVGAKMAEGLKHGDFSVVTVFKRNTNLLQEVATYRGQATGIELGDICIWLATVYNQAFVIPEATIPTLSMYLVKKHYPSIYLRKNEEKVGTAQSPDHFTPGFKCWRTNKQMVIHQSQDALLKGEVQLYSKWLIEEHLQFTNVDGVMQPSGGGTDDGVVCTALAVFAHRESAPPVIEAKEKKVLTETDRLWEDINLKKKRDMRKTQRARKKIVRKATFSL